MAGKSGAAQRPLSEGYPVTVCKLLCYSCLLVRTSKVKPRAKERRLAIAKAEGACCSLGGGPASGPDLPGGQFVQPTIFVDVKPAMRIARKEVFGPVLSVIRFGAEADAIELANDTIYGLAAGILTTDILTTDIWVPDIWAPDIGRAMRVSKALKAGTVSINTDRTSSDMMPFGGMKHSDIGRESGADSIRFASFARPSAAGSRTRTRTPRRPIHSS